MKIITRLSVISGLSLTGLCVALYQTYEFIVFRDGLGGLESVCSFGTFDCRAIDSSTWSEVLPGFPVASFGAAMFMTIFLVSVIARDRFWRDEMARVLTVLTGISVLTSGFYLFVMLKYIGSLCLFCLIQDSIIVLLFGFVLSLKPPSLKTKPLDFSKTKVALFILLGSVLITAGGARLTRATGIPEARLKEMVDKTVYARVQEIRPADYSPKIGSDSAPIKIVKFSDFQCPACRHGALSIEPILHRFRNSIEFIYRNFPLSSKCNRVVEHPTMHPASCEAAKVALCSGKHFKEIYLRFFEKQEKMAPGTPTQWAIDLGLDKDKLEQCMNSEKVRQELSQDIEEGIRLDVQSTPTFFINGRMVRGSIPTQAWEEIILELLKKQG